MPVRAAARTQLLVSVMQKTEPADLLTPAAEAPCCVANWTNIVKQILFTGSTLEPVRVQAGDAALATCARRCVSRKYSASLLPKTLISWLSMVPPLGNTEEWIYL